MRSLPPGAGKGEDGGDKGDQLSGRRRRSGVQKPVSRDKLEGAAAVDASLVPHECRRPHVVAGCAVTRRKA